MGKFTAVMHASNRRAMAALRGRRGGRTRLLPQGLHLVFAFGAVGVRECVRGCVRACMRA
jgi:hypothetical protein